MTKRIENVFIIAAQRTPVAKANGAFKHVRPDDLLSHCLKSVLKSVPTLDPSQIDDVIIGCAMPEAEQGMNVARMSSLLAGLPDSVPAVTINRFCASGLQSIAFAAERIAAGLADVIVAGGTESMTQVPMGGHKYSINPKVFEENEHLAIAYGMGITAEIVAKRWDISREQQDAFSLESHRRAIKATQEKEFENEISPFTVTENFPDLINGKVNSNTIEVVDDEGPRKGSSMEVLAGLRTAFAKDGTITAASSSQMSDGAAALILVSESFLEEHKLEPLAKFIGFATAGVPPEIMGIGPKVAIPKVLTQTDLTLAQIDWIELNEAFAAQTLAVIKELSLDHDKVNPLGGAIALGHPLGATGAIRACTVIHGLRRHKQKYGMVTMCIGTGMGAAGIFEAL